MISYLLESKDDICPRQAGLPPCPCLRTKSRICAVVARPLAPLLTPRPSNSPLLHQAPALSCPPHEASWSYVCSEPTPRALDGHSATHLLHPRSPLRPGFVKFWLPTPRWPSPVGRRRQVAGPGPQIRGAECQDTLAEASDPVREFPKMYPTEYFAFSLGVPSASRYFSPPAAIFAGFTLSAFHSSPHPRQFFPPTLSRPSSCPSSSAPPAGLDLLPCSAPRPGYDAAANLCSRAGARAALSGRHLVGPPVLPGPGFWTGADTRPAQAEIFDCKRRNTSILGNAL